MPLFPLLWSSPKATGRWYETNQTKGPSHLDFALRPRVGSDLRADREPSSGFDTAGPEAQPYHSINSRKAKRTLVLLGRRGRRSQGAWSAFQGDAGRGALFPSISRRAAAHCGKSGWEGWRRARSRRSAAARLGWPVAAWSRARRKRRDGAARLSKFSEEDDEPARARARAVAVQGNTAVDFGSPSGERVGGASGFDTFVLTCWPMSIQCPYRNADRCASSQRIYAPRFHSA